MNSASFLFARKRSLLDFNCCVKLSTSGSIHQGHERCCSLCSCAVVQPRPTSSAVEYDHSRWHLFISQGETYCFSTRSHIDSLPIQNRCPWIIFPLLFSGRPVTQTNRPTRHIIKVHPSRWQALTYPTWSPTSEQAQEAAAFHFQSGTPSLQILLTCAERAQTWSNDWGLPVNNTTVHECHAWFYV